MHTMTFFDCAWIDKCMHAHIKWCAHVDQYDCAWTEISSLQKYTYLSQCKCCTLYLYTSTHAHAHTHTHTFFLTNRRSHLCYCRNGHCCIIMRDTCFWLLHACCHTWKTWLFTLCCTHLFFLFFFCGIESMLIGLDVFAQKNKSKKKKNYRLFFHAYIHFFPLKVHWICVIMSLSFPSCWLACHVDVL